MLTAYSTASLGVHPPYFYPDYRSTVKRAPARPLVVIPPTLSELTGPVYGHGSLGEHDGDLTRQHTGEPVGERIIVTGRVVDEDGRPVRDTLVEIWQANAAGRYVHVVDRTRPPSTRISPAPVAPSPTRRGAIALPPSSPAPTRGRTTPTPGARRTSTSRFSGRRSCPAS
jgi:protocatechuate 3,4-dioxygenase, beta subunit